MCREELNIVRLQQMNRLCFVFLIGVFGTLVSKAIQLEANNRFETVESVYEIGFTEDQVNSYFNGDYWLDSRLSSKLVDLNKIYQERAFSKKLSNDSTVKRYQKSYGTWIEERICPESPYIDKPMRTPMTSHYGRRVHPMSGRSHVHAGIDFRGRTGTPVYAASTGRVKSVRRKGAYGKAIVIEHGNSFTTLYAHLSKYAVKEGQWVNLGQTVGYVGRTGRVTGPHLHFEVRCHNVPLNPRKYLGKVGQVAEVKFKRRYRPWRRTANTARRIQTRTARREPASPAKHDPNYYTRMINLQKLQKMQKKKQ